jgi:AcrR family transcriptional regulator
MQGIPPAASTTLRVMQLPRVSPAKLLATFDTATGNFRACCAEQATDAVDPIDPQERILAVAESYFLRLGYSKVTMSEIADELGMSKKTLYKYFDNKHKLLEMVVRRMHERIHERIEAIRLDKQIPFLERLQKLLHCVRMEFSKINLKALEDIQSNAPMIWALQLELRKKNLGVSFMGFLAEGVENGYFRSDIRPEIVLMMYASWMDTILEKRLFEEFGLDVSQVFSEFIKIFYEGLLTEQGRGAQL